MHSSNGIERERLEFIWVFRSSVRKYEEEHTSLRKVETWRRQMKISCTSRWSRIREINSRGSKSIIMELLEAKDWVG